MGVTGTPHWSFVRDPRVLSPMLSHLQCLSEDREWLDLRGDPQRKLFGDPAGDAFPGDVT